MALLLVIMSVACSLSKATDIMPLVTPTSADITLPKVLPVPTPARLAVVIASRAVNIRRLPTEHSTDIGDLFHNKTVLVIGCQNGWARIKSGGYVKAKYLSINCP